MLQLSHIFFCHASVLEARTSRALPCAVGPNQDWACCKMFSQGTYLQINQCISTSTHVTLVCYIKRSINYADVVIVALRKKIKSPNALGSSPRIPRNAGPRSSVTQSQSRGAMGCILRIRCAQIGKCIARRNVTYEDPNIIPAIGLNHIHLM